MSDVDRLALTIDAAREQPERSRSGEPWALRAQLQRVLNRWRGTKDLTAYRRLALQLHYDLSRGEANRSVLIATPTSSPLPAFASSYIARSLAEQLHSPVILADGSSDRALSAVLGCHSMPGLDEMLASGSGELGHYLLSTSAEHISFLPAGRRSGQGSPAPADRHALLVDAARHSSDFLLISGGAILEDPLSLSLAPHVGCVLLLAVENETRMEDLQEAQETLTRCRSSRVGVVFSRRLPRWASLDALDPVGAGGESRSD